MRIRRWVLAASVVPVLLGFAGCAASSSPSKDAGPTTSLTLLVNPLEPGQGYVQLGGSRYAFGGVICVTGPAKGDPPERARLFGVYANFEVGGNLAAVSLTRYRSAFSGAVRTVPTITDTAMIRMKQGTEVLGLKAQRANVEGQSKWMDVYDSSATTALITRKGDRYEVDGKFGPVDVSAETTKPDQSTETSIGQIAARCPSKSTSSSTTVASVTGSSTTNG